MSSFTYDMGCVGPCVVGLGCASAVGAPGCHGPTHGDYRHKEMEKARSWDKFDGESVLRIIGNFTLTSGDVLVGNSTNNRTVCVVCHRFVWTGMLPRRDAIPHRGSVEKR